MKIQESGENYLETILVLHNRNGYVRSIDVANELGFTKASVSRAMSILRSAGLIVMNPNGNLELTEAGLQRASSVYDRHTTITKFLSSVLGVPGEVAAEDACRIEHVISAESFEAIKRHVQQHMEQR